MEFWRDLLHGLCSRFAPGSVGLRVWICRAFQTCLHHVVLLFLSREPWLRVPIPKPVFPESMVVLNTVWHQS
uniref:Uncharacterized protein n=1 Tax=Kalanchoe fedtschenkoi TaxID=63787 RepID=A0A7N0RF58_KALFE